MSRPEPSPVERDRSLAALIDAFRVLAVPHLEGKTWAEIGAATGMTGPAAKKEFHRLDGELKRILRTRLGKGAEVREELAPHVRAVQAQTGDEEG